MSILIAGVNKPNVETLFIAKITVTESGVLMIEPWSSQMKPILGQIYQLPQHGKLIDVEALEMYIKKQINDEWNQKATPCSWSYAYEQFLSDLEEWDPFIEEDEPNEV